jgi:hypothetical protein
MRPFLLLVLAGFPLVCDATITITGVADKTKNNTSVTFTVTPDPAAVTTTATLDGVATTVGSSVNVTGVSYHELRARAAMRVAPGRLEAGATSSHRSGSERHGGWDSPFTPFRLVNDAPSAFAGGTLKIVAPAAWPAGLPIPLAAVLRNSAEKGCG